MDLRFRGVSINIVCMNGNNDTDSLSILCLFPPLFLHFDMKHKGFACKRFHFVLSPIGLFYPCSLDIVSDLL